MKRTAYRKPATAAEQAAALALVALLPIAVLVIGMKLGLGVNLFDMARDYKAYQDAPTAQVVGPARPNAPVAAPAAPGRAQGAAPVSQPAEAPTSPPVRVPVQGREDAAPAQVQAAPEPPKATPAGKSEPTPEPKRREGKGTP